MYWGQNGYYAYLYVGARNYPYQSSYFSFYYGFYYYAVYYAVAADPGFFDQGTYRTFYNYASGPYLSYYKYTLSAGNGPYTNYPYQTVTKEGTYYQCN
jgi:hypothetical protein